MGTRGGTSEEPKNDWTEIWRYTSIVAVGHDIGSERMSGSLDYGEIVETPAESSSVSPVVSTTDRIGLLSEQYDIKFWGSEHSAETYRHHRVTVGVRLNGSRSGIYCTIEASVGRWYLNIRLTVGITACQLEIYLERWESVRMINE